MMVKNLEEQIAKRKREAISKNIEGKADVIAQYLGTGGRQEDAGRDETAYSFDDQSFEIETSFGCVSGGDGSMGFSGTTITYQGKEVFRQGGGNITLFVPGSWEIPFEALYSRAVRASRRKDAEDRRNAHAKQKEKEAAQRKRWGL